ncbi:gly-3 [Symbiodinium natans]|uniref:Gly-3 protein n=1 Tax=Symbiodinium natans TaxID=878477 RepID=A0A812LH33_9DINO|nr:gly-3 [Symbiodinium natans]
MAWDICIAEFDPRWWESRYEDEADVPYQADEVVEGDETATDPRDVVTSACQQPGWPGPPCEKLNLFLMHHIRPIARWAELRYRIFLEMQKQKPDRVEVFFYQDFRRNATGVLESLARFVGVSPSDPGLQALAQAAASGVTCLATSLLPGFLVASLTRMMKQELSRDLADPWAAICPPTWPAGCRRQSQLNRGIGRIGDTCGARARYCPDLCYRMNTPPFCASLSSGPTTKPCRVDNAGQDWFVSMVPNTVNRGVMHTYFQPIGKRKSSDGDATLEAWKYAWERAGWTTRVLNLSDAQQSPDFEEFNHTLWTKVPLGQGYEYDYQCYIRYLAMEMAGGGWMSDYDVIPTYLPPDVELPNSGTFTVYQQHVPALMSGSKEQWGKVARRLLEQGVKHGSPGHLRDQLFSDMHSMEALEMQPQREFIFINVIADAHEWKDLLNPRCEVIQKRMTLAIHFAHSALDKAGVGIKRRGVVMRKGADRWWQCHGLDTSLFTTSSTTVVSIEGPSSSSEAPANTGVPAGPVDWRFGVGGNASFQLLYSPSSRLEAACTVLNQLGKLRCLGELNCSSDVTCDRDSMYLTNIGNSTGCQPSWPALPTPEEVKAEARLFLQQSLGRVVVLLRDPRDIVLSTYGRAGAKNPDCPDKALFALRHIQPVSRWINLRHRLVTRLREIDPTRAAVLFFEDFFTNTSSMVRSMALFMGVQVSISMLKSLSDVAKVTSDNTTGVRFCLAASAVPDHIGAAMTRRMQRALSPTLWERWRTNCEPLWPKLPPCSGESKLVPRTKFGADTCSGTTGRSCPNLCGFGKHGCVLPGLSEFPEPCNVNQVADFWKSGPQHEVPRGVIHTYYTSTDVTDPEDKRTHTLINWQKAWQRAGWETRVLTIDDARVSENFTNFSSSVLKIPLGGNKMYDYHCYIRYLAMAEAGGGWLSDYDTIPTWLAPDADLPNGGRFTIMQNHVPALMSGTKEEWYRIAHELVAVGLAKGEELAVGDSKNPLFSDMFAMLALRQQDPQPLIFINTVGDGSEWGPDVRKTDCALMRRFSAGMHFSHRSMQEIGLHMNFRGRTMKRATDRFWQCYAESSRSFAFKAENQTTTSVLPHRTKRRTSTTTEPANP